MLWYKAVKRHMTTVDGERYISFDLTVYRVNLRGVRKQLTVVDVSTDAALMRRLAWDCTKGQLEPIHVYDVIVDSIP